MKKSKNQKKIKNLPADLPYKKPNRPSTKINRPTKLSINKISKRKRTKQKAKKKKK